MGIIHMVWDHIFSLPLFSSNDGSHLPLSTIFFGDGEARHFVSPPSPSSLSIPLLTSISLFHVIFFSLIVGGWLSYDRRRLELANGHTPAQKVLATVEDLHPVIASSDTQWWLRVSHGESRLFRAFFWWSSHWIAGIPPPINCTWAHLSIHT